MAAMIEITDLRKRFGPIVAVDGITFTVDKGEVLGFLGPNGAGKSTTMKVISGFLPPRVARRSSADMTSPPRPSRPRR